MTHFPRKHGPDRAVGSSVQGLIGAVLLCLISGGIVHAQSASPGEGTVNSAKQAPAVPVAASLLKNSFGESLRSRIKRPRMVLSQPYDPIKSHDDPAPIPEIEMFVGESRVFPAPAVARIAVGNGQIMTAAALDNKEVIIFANAVGTSSLFIWNEDGRYQRVKVNIVPGDTSRIASEVAKFLSAIPNAKAAIVGDKVIVEGDNLSDADLAKIEQLGLRYPQIVNFTNRLGWEQMVMMDVKVVEFPVTELRDVGFKWGTTGGAAIGGVWAPIRRGNAGPYQLNIISGQDTPAPVTNQSGGLPVIFPQGLNILSAVNLGLNAQLNLLAQEGRTSILAEPQLSTRNGTKASFLAGGEFPYVVSTINGPSVFFKPYGVKLDILPRVDKNGVIRATVEYEVSSIDDSITTAAGPALRTRKTNTEFNVKSGETIVLSGLLAREDSTNIEKLPFLGDIPILGALFKSKRYQNKETELVVFVTPMVIDSHSPGLVDRVERAAERLQQNLGERPYLGDPLQPGHDPVLVGPSARSSADIPLTMSPTLTSPTPARAIQNGSGHSWPESPAEKD